MDISIFKRKEMLMDIYVFDNSGRNLPERFGTYCYELLIGKTLTEAHNNISGHPLALITFTHIANVDFIVPTEEDKQILKGIFTEMLYNFNITVSDNSIWYSKKAKNNIIISDSVFSNKNDLESFLHLYINAISNKGKEEKKREMYIIENKRSGNIILKTPDFELAKKTCDKNPCCVIHTRDGKHVYNSAYGKVDIPYTPKGKLIELKAMVKDNFAHFKI